MFLKKGFCDNAVSLTTAQKNRFLGVQVKFTDTQKELFADVLKIRGS